MAGDALRARKSLRVGGGGGRPMTPGDTDTRNIPEQRAAAELRAQGHSGGKVR